MILRFPVVTPAYVHDFFFFFDSVQLARRKPVDDGADGHIHPPRFVLAVIGSGWILFFFPRRFTRPTPPPFVFNVQLTLSRRTTLTCTRHDPWLIGCRRVIVRWRFYSPILCLAPPPLPLLSHPVAVPACHLGDERVCGGRQSGPFPRPVGLLSRTGGCHRGRSGGD